MTDRPETLPESWMLGLPIFACPAWKGSVYPPKAPRTEWLTHYARRYRTVEGNSTFYALPSADVVRSWIEKTYPGFRFSFKFPQAITHQRQLEDADAETKAFLETLWPLHAAKRLAPTMVQLPPFFGPDRLPKLLKYLDDLPRELEVAVEPRHVAFFEGGPAEERLDRELADRGVERVLMDSRCLFSAPPRSDAERDARRKKPNLPVKVDPLTDRPIVRLICRDSLEETEPWLAEWAGHLAHWIERGKRPILFLHAPDDAAEPAHTARLLELLADKGIAPPVLPGDDGAATIRGSGQQGSLF